MFERRLKVILTVPAVCFLILAGRLYQLQIVHGAAYVERAEDALISPRQFLPPLRGRILDRFGQALVSDEPAHDVTMHYGALSVDDDYLQQLARHIHRHEPAWRTASHADCLAEARRQIADTWRSIENVSGESLSQLRARRDDICTAVERLRRHIWKARRRQGIDQPLSALKLREETMFHPIIRDVTPEQRTVLELATTGMPFIRIEPSVRRVWLADTRAVCHVLGRLGQVSPEMIHNDPRAGDWLAGYRAGDEVGISGAEALGEQMLRGKRGYEVHNLDGEITESRPPIDGLDVQLTIDVNLQARIADILDKAVATSDTSTGASCVVLDVASREILALVSVPIFERDDLRNDYARFRDDAKYRPLLFRAVAEEYQPGSILKPVALLGAFAHHTLSAEQRVVCDGAYIPGAAHWHCWTHWRNLPGHGALNAEEAIQHSCNVYFYGLGEKLGGQRITDFYAKFIWGETDPTVGYRGTGLIGERSGIIPTAQWLAAHRDRGFRRADGRNYAIGQGEIQLTPLLAANAFATLAAGHYEDPTLLANDGRPRRRIAVDRLDDFAWNTVRRGLYRCVNELGGTAYSHARMDELEICGKTGSAQCVSQIIRSRYTFETDAGTTASAEAPTIEAAREALDLDPNAKLTDRKILERWPPPEPDDDEPPTHAWFAGFAPYRDPKIAIAVVIEYGGSGGRTAGPVARSVFHALLESPRGYLVDQRLARGSDAL